MLASPPTEIAEAEETTDYVAARVTARSASPVLYDPAPPTLDEVYKALEGIGFFRPSRQPEMAGA